MKIGIITWYKDINYGTALQALALQYYIKTFNHEAYLLDFDASKCGRSLSKKNDVTFVNNLKIKFKGTIGNLIRIYIRILYKKNLDLRKSRFKSIIDEKSEFSEYINNDIDFIKICNEFDLLIFGSDQIWTPNGFHKYWYGDFADIITKKISYAPSIGVEAIPEDQLDDYKRVLDSFDRISIREYSGKSLLQKLGYYSELVVDPTLLLDRVTWRKLLNTNENIEQKYVLVYFLTDNLNYYRAITKYAKDKALKIKVIPYQKYSYFLNADICADTGPREFFSLIDNSEIIFTDSYHGMLFSLICNKQFLIFERFSATDSMSQNSRIYQIVNEYQLEGYLIKYNSQDSLIRESINYACINKVIQKNIEISKAYLAEEIH